MNYTDIQKGANYHGRRVNNIFPLASDWAGPGLNSPTAADDDVAYQDFQKGLRDTCSARAFAAWVTKQGKKY